MNVDYKEFWRGIQRYAQDPALPLSLRRRCLPARILCLTRGFRFARQRYVRTCYDTAATVNPLVLSDAHGDAQPVAYLRLSEYLSRRGPPATVDLSLRLVRLTGSQRLYMYRTEALPIAAPRPDAPRRSRRRPACRSSA